MKRADIQAGLNVNIVHRTFGLGGQKVNRSGVLTGEIRKYGGNNYEAELELPGGRTVWKILSLIQRG